MNPYAITGAGVVSPIGVGYAAFAASMAAGKAPGEGARRSDLVTVPPARIPEATAFEVCDFDAATYLGPKGLRNFDRLTRFMIVSARMALLDAGVKREDGQHVLPPDRIGVASATAYGSLGVINDMVRVTELEDPRFLSPGQFPNTVINSAAGYISIWEDLQACNLTVVDGNCGALDAVLTAETQLCSGRADAMVVGGGEALSEPLYLAFRKLGLLADREGRRKLGAPDSAGTILGEGAAYVVLERFAGARARGARPRAEVIGYGKAIEPPASEAALTHGSAWAVERAISAALADAGVAGADVDLVSASVSGIPAFDLPELDGLARALPGVPVVGPKAWYGEPLGAGGAFGMISALSWLEGVQPRPLIAGELPAKLDHVLVVSTGYYGNASAVLMRRAEST